MKGETIKASCEAVTPLQESAAVFQNMSVETNATAGTFPVLNDNTAGTTSPVTQGTEHSGNEEDNELNDYIGWEKIESFYVPYIKRTFNGETLNYVSVQIAETHPLSKYIISLLVKLYTCPAVKSFFITEFEAQLLNNINKDQFYGKGQFYGGKDCIVRLEDVKELYAFIEACFKQLLCNTASARQRKCGFISINSKFAVPYSIKDNHKYIPLFCFEGEIDSLSQHAIKLENWDLAYLKFCSRVQGVRNELETSDSCTVVRLDDIKKYFSFDTNFEEYWPSNVADLQVFPDEKTFNASSSWIRVPDPSENPYTTSASTLEGLQLSVPIWSISKNQMIPSVAKLGLSDLCKTFFEKIYSNILIKYSTYSEMKLGDIDLAKFTQMDTHSTMNTLINQQSIYTPINNLMAHTIPQPFIQAGIQSVPIIYNFLYVNRHMSSTPMYSPLYDNQMWQFYDVQRFNNDGQVQQQQQILNQPHQLYGAQFLQGRNTNAPMSNNNVML
ncbi:Hypothetical protein CINCED_3A013979 [Cinara cedri]|uniref:Uncharacterized protein n=1 Tax=Cinara cedri TaxID=506608 RepID=A0A5E4NJF9_9HEMI|nr:Hypothetical protein CINCED_3A013979 [Cinara cedri]